MKPMAIEPTVPEPNKDSRAALIGEISSMTVSDLPSARAFAIALERTLQTFGLDVIAVYAGEPLTLRHAGGGRAGKSWGGRSGWVGSPRRR